MGAVVREGHFPTPYQQKPTNQSKFNLHNAYWSSYTHMATQCVKKRGAGSTSLLEKRILIELLLLL